MEAVCAEGLSVAGVLCCVQREQGRLTASHKELKDYHYKMAVTVLAIKRLMADQARKGKGKGGQAAGAGGGDHHDDSDSAKTPAEARLEVSRPALHRNAHLTTTGLSAVVSPSAAFSLILRML
jgi:hypothetical protein